MKHKERAYKLLFTYLVACFPIWWLVFLFGGLFVLLIITNTWLLGDSAYFQPRGVTMSAL